MSQFTVYSIDEIADTQSSQFLHKISKALLYARAKL